MKLFFVLLSLHNAQQTDINEKASLEMLYWATGGTRWINQWDLTTDPCVDRWYGIACNPSGHIISINLPANNLVGHLPEHFARFQLLEHLELRHNTLFGPLPTNLNNLVSLKSLKLSHNRLIGEVPENIGELGELRELFLDANELEELPDKVRDLSHTQSTQVVF